ncbi:MAG: hypothetical protein RR436_03840 [Clostridia bacterium]
MFNLDSVNSEINSRSIKAMAGSNDAGDEEIYEGTMQSILIKNIGNYASIEFLIGTSALVRKEGVLFSVGISYVTLYDNLNGVYTVCDIYSIKFVNFFEFNTLSNRINNSPNLNDTFTK